MGTVPLGGFLETTILPPAMLFPLAPVAAAEEHEAAEVEVSDAAAAMPEAKHDEAGGCCGSGSLVTMEAAETALRVGAAS